MCINDFVVACAVDGSPPYFTYEEETMLIINSEKDENLGRSGFTGIEPHIEGLVSHESIHVVIRRLIDGETSDALDDLEVMVHYKGLAFQVTLNNLAFARDASGLVLPWE